MPRLRLRDEAMRGRPLLAQERNGSPGQDGGLADARLGCGLRDRATGSGHLFVGHARMAACLE